MKYLATVKIAFKKKINVPKLYNLLTEVRCSLLMVATNHTKMRNLLVPEKNKCCNKNLDESNF